MLFRLGGSETPIVFRLKEKEDKYRNHVLKAKEKKERKKSTSALLFFFSRQKEFVTNNFFI